LIATILSSFIKVLINPFLAANLSPKDYAIIGYFYSFTTLFLPIISFSLLTYYARNYFLLKENKRQEVLDTLIISQVFLGLVALIVILAAFYLYMEFTGVNFPFFPYAFLCFIPVYFNCFYNFLLVDKRMKRQALSFLKITIFNTVLIALFAILLVVILKKGAIGRFWGVLIPAVGMGIFSFLKLITNYQFSWKIFRASIVFGWPISLSAILYYFISDIDRAMLENLNDTNTLGIYNVAVQITAYLIMFYTAIKQTFEPDIFQAIAENNRIKLVKIVAGILVLNAVPTIVFIIFAHPVINILTYGRYLESVGFARILAITNIPMSLWFIISTVVIGYGYPKVELVSRIIGALLSILIFSLLITKYGFTGAAWGKSIVLTMMAFLSSLFVVYKILQKKNDS